MHFSAAAYLYSSNSNSFALAGRKILPKYIHICTRDTFRLSGEIHLDFLRKYRALERPQIHLRGGRYCVG